MTAPSRPALTLAAFAAAMGLLAGVALGKGGYPALDVLLKRSDSVLGQPLAYPGGEAEVTAAIITMAPGQATGWHRHDVPLLAYVLEGEMSVDYGEAGVRIYGAGEAFLEAFHSEHDGVNSGAQTLRLLAVYMGAAGAPNTVPRGE